MRARHHQDDRCVRREAAFQVAVEPVPHLLAVGIRSRGLASFDRIVDRDVIGAEAGDGRARRPRVFAAAVVAQRPLAMERSP